jgi:hypothetical protein
MSAADRTLVDVTLGIRLASRANVRGNWRVAWRRDKEQGAVVRMAVTAALPRKRTPPYVVTLVRVGPRRLDDDNNVGAFKAVRDTVAACLGVDDGDRAAVTWRYDQATSKVYGIRIVVTQRSVRL